MKEVSSVRVDPPLVANAENSAAADATSRPQSAYVHVPFCLHRCGYCDFTVVAGRDDLIDGYLDCLEIELRSQLLEPRSVNTLFLGGGTPSYLSPGELTRLFRLLNFWLPLEADAEFSMECNPERFTTERMDVIREAGVNRISLGVQSFQTTHLKTLERSHNSETVSTVLENLRARGFSNLSLDLIFGIPGQSFDDWSQTLEIAIDFTPQHISTYGLTYEKGTAFWTRRQKNSLRPATEELEREMYALAMSRLPKEGFRQYELSNFAVPGSECRHNQVYWQGASYYGIGPGAAGFQQGIRTLNHRSVTTWMKRLQQGNSPIQEQEVLDMDLRSREAVMLGFRQIEGIDQSEFSKRFSRTVRDLAPQAYDQFREQGWLEETETSVRLTPAGRFVADTVMSEFL